MCRLSREQISGHLDYVNALRMQTAVGGGLRMARCHAHRQPLVKQVVACSKTTLGRRHSMRVQASSSDLVSFEEVQQVASKRGLSISLSELGPFYRIICRVAPGGDHDRILALTTGFTAPIFGLMHCDTLQVFTAGMKGDKGDRVRGGALGLGLLMGGAVFSHGLRRGCKKAEILAINDDESWHQRLVRYYRFFGFEPVVVVEGDKLSDLPHMLVWGGAGTRMDADVQRMLRKWSPALKRAAQGEEQGGEQDVAVADVTL